MAVIVGCCARVCDGGGIWSVWRDWMDGGKGSVEDLALVHS